MTNSSDRRKAVSARLHAQIAALTSERDEARAQRDGMAFWIRQCRNGLERMRENPGTNTLTHWNIRLAELDRALALPDCPAHDERTHICQLRNEPESESTP